MSVGHCLYAYGKSRHFFQMQIYLLKSWLQITEAQMALRQLQKMGARVISVARQGYGNALTGGINAARGRYIIMGDCDYSYDFSGLQPFVDALREGYDFVIGNRFPEQWRCVPCLFCIDIWGFLCSLIWAGNDFIHLFTIFIVAYAVFPQMLFVVCICSVPEWNLQQK